LGVNMCDLNPGQNPPWTKSPRTKSPLLLEKNTETVETTGL